MNHVYTCQARNDDLTRKQNVFSSTFVCTVLVFYKLLELNELWSSIFFVVQKSSGHKPTKSFHQWTFFSWLSSHDPQPALIALPPTSTKQEAQAVPQHNGFLAQDCSMMRPEKWNQAIYIKHTCMIIKKDRTVIYILTPFLLLISFGILSRSAIQAKFLPLISWHFKKLPWYQGICFNKPRMYWSWTLFTASKL